MVSAVKVGGRRLHELARRGEEIERDAAPRAHRPNRHRSLRAGSVSGRDRAGRVQQRHLHPVAGRGPRRRASAVSPTSVAPPAACRFVHARRGASPRRHRSGPRAAVLLTRSTADARPRAGRASTPEQARAVAHGVDVPGAVFAGGTPGPDRSRSSTPDGELLAVYERAARRCKPAVVLAAGRGDRDPRAAIVTGSDDADLARGADRRRVVTIGAYDGVHLGHRPCCGSCASSPTPAGSTRRCVTFDRHPAEVVRPESAPSCSRRSSRSSSCSTRPATSTCAACSLRRGAQQGAGGGLRARGARRAAAARGSWSSAPTSTSATAGAATCRCSSRWVPSSASRCSAWARRRRGRPDRRAVLVDPDPRAAGRGDVAERGARCSAGPTRCAGVGRAGRPAGPRARLPDRQPRGPGADLPARRRRSTRATFVGEDGVERPAAISLGRRPTFYEDGERRCSRRTCSTSTATSTASRCRSASWSGSGARRGSTASRRWSSR